MSIKILGREPALWIALIGAALTWIAGFNPGFLSSGQAVALTSVASGLMIALTTRPIAPGLFVAAVGSLAALFGEYGLHWSDGAVTGSGALILAVFALFGIRPQVTPVAESRTRPTGDYGGED